MSACCCPWNSQIKIKTSDECYEGRSSNFVFSWKYEDGVTYMTTVSSGFGEVASYAESGAFVLILHVHNLCIKHSVVRMQALRSIGHTCRHVN